MAVSLSPSSTPGTSGMSDLDPSVRLRAFLHTGEDRGDRGIFYTPPHSPEEDLSDTFDHYKALDETLARLASTGNGADAARHVLDVTLRGTSPRRNALLFALAKMMAVKDPAAMATAARNIVFRVIRDNRPDDMLTLYFYFIKSKKGKGGKGIRNILRKWFNEQRPQDLLRVQSKHMTIKDIILLGHFKGVDQAHEVLISYFLFGLQKTTAKFDNLDDAANACLAYIERVDHLKRSGSDPSEAVKLVKNHYFDITAVPSELYGNEEIWALCLSRMNLSKIIYYMKTVSRRGYLANIENKCGKIIHRELGNVSAIGPSTLQPVDIYKCYKYAKASWKSPEVKEKPAGKKKKKPNEVAIVVANEFFLALEKLTTLCYQNLCALEKTILVCVDNRPSMEQNTCWRMHHVTHLDAAAIIILSLANAKGANVELCVFGKEQEFINEVEFCKDDSVEQLKKRLQTVEVGLLDLTRPVDWAVQRKKRFDGIVCLTGCHTYCDKEKLWKKLDLYRQAVQPEARYVFHASGTRDGTMSRKNDPFMFDIVGFDVHVPRLISSFINGEF